MLIYLTDPLGIWIYVLGTWILTLELLLSSFNFYSRRKGNILSISASEKSVKNLVVRGHLRFKICPWRPPNYMSDFIKMYENFL